MNKIIFLIVLSFIFTQCTNEVPTISEQENLNLGKVSLRIDKQMAPAEVVMVEAFLSRENYDTLYGYLNLLSSTSAEILIEDINSGEWHLKVDAIDSAGVVLYTGETVINILAGIINQVQLTLVPTGYGTGSIYILVNWGTASHWIDFISNPIFTIEDSPFNPWAVTQGVIIKDDNLYKMWYNNIFASGVSKVGYAHSPNGVDWNISNTYSLVPGEIGSWDNYSVSVGYVVKEGNNFLMYYSGNNDTYGYWHIGLATSVDGINWIKHHEPILLGDFYEQQLHPNSIIKVNNQYMMYYTYRNPNGNTFHNMGMAVSNDGINWIKNSNNPILTSTQNWEGSGIYYPSVIYENNIFKMVYMNTLGDAFGMATSSDGFNWNKINSNPIFTQDETHNYWATRSIAYPYIFKVDNEYRIYYTGGHTDTYNSSLGIIRKFGNL